ncbi:DNA mismatch repair protein MutS [Acetobacterium sp.]|uniref:MutS-related protein n=1 Tax=Acetobacterium sp. TaxID=1872094 RepID=UPI00359329F0
MEFKSILYQTGYEETPVNLEPAYFRDLNLDQLINAITLDKEDYALKAFFYSPLKQMENIHFRQAIASDLDNDDFFRSSAVFSEKIFALNQQFGQCLTSLNRSGDKHQDYLEKGRYLDLIESYCEEVRSYYACLTHSDLKALGFLSLRDFLGDYLHSDAFVNLSGTTSRLKDELFALDYCILINGDTVKVKKYDGEPDHSSEVIQLLERFNPKPQAAAHEDKLHEGLAAHVENNILNLAAKLYPQSFAQLNDYCLNHHGFMNPVILNFSRELQFYIAYLDYIRTIKKMGLSFSLPEVTNSKTDLYNDDGFDLVLAAKLTKAPAKMVCNSFYLKNNERIILISGPNQGGKTTFSRHFGQIHHLGCLGLPIQGSRSKIFHFDQIFTHFEQEENINSLQGKLSDDLLRMKAIFDAATPNSLVIINEILSSTTLNDAVLIGQKLITMLANLDLICVFVTFITELASCHEKIVSMVSMVSDVDASARTYTLIRKEPDGLAYANHIVQRYHLDYLSINERISS